MLEDEVVDLASLDSDTEDQDQDPALTPDPALVPAPAANLNVVVGDMPNGLAMAGFEAVETT
jgi:hypothetical protein